MQSDFLTENNVKRPSRGRKVAKAVSFAVLALFGIVGYAGYQAGQTEATPVVADKGATNLMEYYAQYGQRVQ